MADLPREICAYCKHDILSGPKGCERSYQEIKGERFKRLTWGLDAPCPGCGTLPNRYHHAGCDMEICPGCHKYVISLCRCNDEPTEARQGGESRYTILRSAGIEPAQTAFIYDRQEQLLVCHCFNMDVATRVCVALNRDEAGKEGPPSFPGKVSG